MNTLLGFNTMRPESYYIGHILYLKLLHEHSEPQ